MNIRYPIYEGVYRILTLELSCQQTKIRQIYRNYEKLSLILQQIHTLVTKNGTPCIKYF